MSSPCGRRPDHHAVRRPESAQCRRHRSMDDHEGGRVGRSSELSNSQVQFGTDLEGNDARGHRLHSGPRVVGGQLRYNGLAGTRRVTEDRGPERELLVGNGVHVRSVPYGVVTVLRAQAWPRGRVSGTARGVCDGEVSYQWVDRPPVHRDVVHHDHDDGVAGVVHAEQRCADGHFGGYVESLGCGFCRRSIEIAFRDIPRGYVAEDGVGGPDHLSRAVAVVRVVRA